ncbi:alpha/beta fold hydrolase [Prochlorothrix hollandica]|uniref:Alpha/beta hydrolase n=1 Tax=Prochlorothrix hollandica PCC 9006 = CALU 1027 TaxID=317619 RepID=A0A0M2Q292_PROHO|nr:alpha/beta hydrolase [Prochlorothrix hollandica]KKJ01378.1 alpha/beta hydrolase [Prochlorothrix hollandica PCC 9006 = CALU 1027]
MPYLAVHGVDHYYQWMTAKGIDRDPAKPVMVFIHGWGGSSRYWQSTAQALTPDYDCLLYDLRGFGRSTQAGVSETPGDRQPADPKAVDPKAVDPTALDPGAVNPGAMNPNAVDSKGNAPQPIAEPWAGYSLESYGEDLRELLDQLGLERISLNAHSLGASMALLFLNRYPQRLDRAILTCNGLLEYNALAFRLFHIFSRYVVLFRPRWFLQVPGLDRMFMSRFLHRSIPSSERRAFLEDFLDADFEAALGTAVKTVSQAMAEATPQEYQQLQVPTLLVSGQYDQIITAPMGEAAAALNPQVQYRRVARTGHFPMLEDAPTYLDYVREFLRSVPSSAADPTLKDPLPPEVA